MNINNCVDKAFETKTLKELVNAPVSALQGVSDTDGELLYKAFHIKTIGDFAKLKYVKWAQAICTLAEGEE